MAPPVSLRAPVVLPLMELSSTLTRDAGPSATTPLVLPEKIERFAMTLAPLPTRNPSAFCSEITLASEASIFTAPLAGAMVIPAPALC